MISDILSWNSASVFSKLYCHHFLFPCLSPPHSTPPPLFSPPPFSLMTSFFTLVLTSLFCYYIYLNSSHWNLLSNTISPTISETTTCISNNDGYIIESYSNLASFRLHCLRFPMSLFITLPQSRYLNLLSLQSCDPVMWQDHGVMHNPAIYLQ